MSALGAPKEPAAPSALAGYAPRLARELRTMPEVVASWPDAEREVALAGLAAAMPLADRFLLRVAAKSSGHARRFLDSALCGPGESGSVNLQWTGLHDDLLWLEFTPPPALSVEALFESADHDFEGCATTKQVVDWLERLAGR